MKVLPHFKPCTCMEVIQSFLIVFALVGCSHLIADEPEAKSTTALSNRWLMICCGLPGDVEHRERLGGACKKIVAAAEPVFGIAPERVRLLVGDEEMQDSLSSVVDQPPRVSTRESVENAIAKLCEQVAADDECWIVLLGHAHLYDGRSQFNIQGPDFDQTQFAAWVKPLAARQQVFLLTMPVSGFWIKPLAGPSRCVVSATEADHEFTGTEMPYALADLLAGEGEHEKLRDVDGDATISLLDLYLAMNLEIHGRFTSMERLQTEHAQLDDNGDGRGSEVQQRYLPPPKSEDAESVKDESDGSKVVETPPPISNESLDGFRSRQILINQLSPESSAE